MITVVAYRYGWLDYDDIVLYCDEDLEEAVGLALDYHKRQASSQEVPDDRAATGE